MSAELDMIRKAATILRERAEAATPGGWVPFGNNIGATVDKCTCSPIHDPYEMHQNYCGIEGPIVQACDSDIDYIATMHPGVGLALADWLEVTAGGHEPGGTEELVLHPDTPCSVCEESGHEVEVCAGCFPSWDGLDCRVAYPCVEVRNALPLVRLIVGEQS